MSYTKEDFDNLSNRLFEASVQINAARDNLNDSVRGFEDVISKFHLGVSAWIDKGRFSLGYSKVDKKWGLYLRDTNKSEKEKDWQYWTFYQAPSNLRCDAVFWFPELLEKLLINCQDMAEKLKAATREVNLMILQAMEEGLINKEEK